MPRARADMLPILHFAFFAILFENRFHFVTLRVTALFTRHFSLRFCRRHAIFVAIIYYADITLHITPPLDYYIFAAALLRCRHATLPCFRWLMFSCYGCCYDVDYARYNNAIFRC